MPRIATIPAHTNCCQEALFVLLPHHMDHRELKRKDDKNEYSSRTTRTSTKLLVFLPEKHCAVVHELSKHAKHEVVLNRVAATLPVLNAITLNSFFVPGNSTALRNSLKITVSVGHNQWLRQYGIPPIHIFQPV